MEVNRVKPTIKILNSGASKDVNNMHDNMILAWINWLHFILQYVLFYSVRKY